MAIPALKNRTVVIADDDGITRGLLRGLLRTIGLQVLDEAADGVQAFACFEKHQPQIVCLDIDMPGMDGFEVLAKIRQAGSSAVVLMISAAATADNVKQSLTAKADGFIAKPFSAAKIAREIERALAQRSAVAKPSQA